MRLFDKIFGDSYDRHMKKPMRMYTNPVSEECYNLDLVFVDFMVPRLKLFKKEASEIIEYDFTIVDKIIEGFELFQNKFDWSLEEAEANYAKFQESMKLFAEHIAEFWW